MYEVFIDRLSAHDVDTTTALRRFVGSTDLYGKYLCAFPQDENFAHIAPALESDDFEAALTAVHTLKGVSGNLGMDRLFAACSETVALLRAQQYEQAKQSYAVLKAAYDDVCGAIAQCSGD